MSSRAAIKFSLGDASRVKWSRMRPRAQELLDQCLSAWDDKSIVLNNPGRWDSPQFTEDVKKSFDETMSKSTSAPDKSVSAADVWATAINVQLFKRLDNLQQFLFAQRTSSSSICDHIAFYIGHDQSECPSEGDRVLSSC